jgi:ATP-binding cassette subfamily F protein 3
VGSRTLSIEDGGVRSYDGGWAEFVRVREERKAAEAVAKTAATKKKTGGASNGSAPKAAKPKPAPGTSKNARKRIASLERDIEAAEKALGALEEELADPSAWASPTSSERSSARHADAKRKVERLYEELSAAGG